MRKRLIAVIATAALTAPVLADYVANFDSNGSASDFTTVRTANSNGQTVTVVSAGDNRLNFTTQRNAGTNQVQYAIAPTLAEGAEVAFPVGTVADANRTEARLKFNLESTTIGTVTPFTAFGFAGFDSTTNTAHFEDKLIIQLNDVLTQFVVRAAADVPGVPGGGAKATLAATVTLPSTIEMQVTADKVRILLNNAPLTSVDTDADGWVRHDLTLTASTNDTGFTGDSLIPYFGIIKSGADSNWHQPSDFAGIGLDDINATTQAVPEPASVSLLALISFGLLKRPKSRN